jgi:hypothetical protein
MSKENLAEAPEINLNKIAKPETPIIIATEN